jgi:diaminopimelate epimerase
VTGSGVAFLKGHGTKNDFVLIPDLDDALILEPADVAALCDRRSGIGADGVLRVVPAAAGSPARFFMDYRNADGSIAEMCGNGLRVFARHLVRAGLEEAGDFVVDTRAGLRSVTVPDLEADVTVDLGTYTLMETDAPVVVDVDGAQHAACGVDMGNPHAVAFVADLAEAGDLWFAPSVTPAAAYPHGVNVEFVVDRGPRHVAMRVHERGSGETQSCGTGAGAVAVAAAVRAGDGLVGEWQVDVPGGTLRVLLGSDHGVRLSGPAEIVAEGVLLGALRPRTRVSA